MGNLIEERVELAQAGRNPTLIQRMASGWLVIGDRQTLPGYCLLLADPVVESLNALGPPMRAQYCLDAARAGDALLAVTSAYRINYETWGNLDPALHTHIVPGYRDEPEPQRFQPVCVGYDQARAPIRSTDRRAVHGGDAEGVVRHDLGPGAAPAREFGQWLVEKRIDAL